MSFGHTAGWWLGGSVVASIGGLNVRSCCRGWLGRSVVQSAGTSAIRSYIWLLARLFGCKFGWWLVWSYKESAITRGTISLSTVNMPTLFIRHKRSSQILLIEGR